MAKLRVTLACGDYDLLSPLISGVVQPPGMELNLLTMASPERHGRMLRHEEFDVCELSLVAYLLSWERKRSFTAIPVFPHRRFRHGYMVKRAGCGVDRRLAGAEQLLAAPDGLGVRADGLGGVGGGDGLAIGHPRNVFQVAPVAHRSFTRGS